LRKINTTLVTVQTKEKGTKKLVRTIRKLNKYKITKKIKKNPWYNSILVACIQKKEETSLSI